MTAKRNEITAIPELLDSLYLKSFLVSIDAMGCQRAIAEKINTMGEDYLLTVKDNQPNLHQAIQDAFMDHPDQVVHVEQGKQGHGRIVAQHCSVLPATGIVPESDWPRCAVIARTDSVHQIKGKPLGTEQRCYIASRDHAPSIVTEAVRSHRGIENQFHWVLHVTMKEDACTVRKGNAQEDLSLLKKIVLNLLRMDTSDTVKSSLRLKRKRAAWDDELRMRFLGLTPL